MSFNIFLKHENLIFKEQIFVTPENAFSKLFISWLKVRGKNKTFENNK